MLSGIFYLSYAEEIAPGSLALFSMFEFLAFQ